MAVEAFEFGEIGGVGEIAVEDADRVRRIEGRQQVAAVVADRAQVARRDIAGGADESEALLVR
jgi:hypothetical protein